MCRLLENSNPLSVSIARQPVFDDTRRLWGYELFCLGFPQESSVAISVQSSAYVCLQQMTVRGKRIIIDFTEKSILQNLPYALPPVLAVVKISEQLLHRPSIMALLTDLRADGYLIAVGDFTGNPEYDSLYKLAHILNVDVSQKNKEMLAPSLESARKYHASLMATRVQNGGQFKLCQDLGFSFFHGPFFKSPDQITVRKLSSNEVLRLNLLKVMKSEEPSFARLAESIQADPTISVRLLAYLNSAAFAIPQKIKSIQQAIVLLGWRNVRNWLRVVVLTDISQGKDAQELVLLSAQRGYFLELVARDHDFWGFEPESVHLLGLFSLLDALMGVPMADVVANLPLDNKMKAALCREQNNEYLPLLELAQDMEEARWEDADRLMQQLNLNGGKVKTAFQTSVNWSSELESLRS